jgi:XapX domain-containing protein
MERTMPYLISLAAGFAVGLLYSLVRVQSPAPPLIALVGLLGIVLGEHAIPFVQAQLRPSITQGLDSRAEMTSRETTLHRRDK